MDGTRPRVICNGKLGTLFAFQTTVGKKYTIGNLKLDGFCCAQKRKKYMKYTCGLCWWGTLVVNQPQHSLLSLEPWLLPAHNPVTTPYFEGLSATSVIIFMFHCCWILRGMTQAHVWTRTKTSLTVCTSHREPKSRMSPGKACGRFESQRLDAKFSRPVPETLSTRGIKGVSPTVLRSHLGTSSPCPIT